MKQEELVNKGVEKHFDGQKVLFKVESLKEHFEGLQIHESDIVSIEEVDYVIAGDVNFDNATANEVAPKVEEEIGSGITYEEAEIFMGLGELIALPEWGGFWFKNIKTDEILVLTKEGEITNTPFEEFKERNDWITVEATPKQQEILDNYFAVKQRPVSMEDIDVVLDKLSIVTGDEIIGTEEVASIKLPENAPEGISYEVQVSEPVVEAPAKAVKPKKAK